LLFLRNKQTLMLISNIDLIELYRVIMEIPRLLLILLAIPRLIVLFRRPALSVPNTFFYFAKVGIPLVIAGLFAADAIINNTQSALVESPKSATPPHTIWSSWIGVAVNVFASVLHHIEHFRSSVGSTALLFYWLFSIIALGVKVRTVNSLGN
jgi:hypothetical protein